MVLEDRPELEEQGGDGMMSMCSSLKLCFSYLTPTLPSALRCHTIDPHATLVIIDSHVYGFRAGRASC